MWNQRTENSYVWSRCMGRNSIGSRGGSENSSSPDDQSPPPKRSVSSDDEDKSDNSSETIKKTDELLRVDEKRFHLNNTMYEETLNTFKLRYNDERYIPDYERLKAQYTSWRREQIKILCRKLHKREVQANDDEYDAASEFETSEDEERGPEPERSRRRNSA